MESMFILGRESALSVAEIEARLKDWGGQMLEVHSEVALIRHPQVLPSGTLNHLGGSIKQVTVLDCLSKTGDPWRQMSDYFTQDWVQKQFPTGRIEFGVSIYGGTRALNQQSQRHFLRLKKELTADGRVVRLVTSREPQLSAVTIIRNGLLKKGKEFVVYTGQQYLVIGHTVAVQDYQAYGLRDFGRPAANAKSGMLPPKVAQMMLNLGQATSDDILLDPFCGSGTVLQEAALLGVKDIHGSDVDVTAVKASQENMRWLLKEFPRLTTTLEILKNDARQTSVRPTLILTEPSLGKPLRGNEPANFLKTQLHELSRLYLESFRRWSMTMSAGGRVVMVWPEFMIDGRPTTVEIENDIERFGFQPQQLLSNQSAKVLNHPNPFVLSYGRPDAKVRRQIRKWILPPPRRA